MDYKKILAATAVTSAAIVVPVVAQAEDTTVKNLVELVEPNLTFQYGEKIEAIKELTFEITKDDGSKEKISEKIVKYEWKLILKNASGTKITKTTTSNELVIPVDATLGADIELTVTTTEGNTATQKDITIISVESSNIKFKDLSDENTGNVTESNVNTPVSLQFNFSEDTIITKYEWYIYDEKSSEYYLLSDQTDMLIDIPVLASGKKLIVIVQTKKTDSSDKINQHRADLNVEKLILSPQVNLPLKINGKSIVNDSALAPGDVLSIAPFTIKGQNDLVILPSQANIQYQWLFTNKGGETSSIISDATNTSFTIPNDAFYRSLDSFKVRINVEVPDANESIVYFSQFVEFNVKDAEKLVNGIELLYTNSNEYNTFTDIFDIEKQIKELQKSYENLSANSKLLVTNYQKLLEAEKNVKLVKPILKDLQTFDTDLAKYNGLEITEVTHAKLTKQFDTSYKKYLKLNTLQRSLLKYIYENKTYDAVYIEEMNQYLKNLLSEKITYTKVDEINNAIGKLIDSTNGSFIKLYNLSDSINEFKLEVTRIQAEIKKLDKKQQPLVNSSLIKTALTDAKKAQVVIDKIELLEDTKLVGKNKTNALIAAQREYAKLTYLQKSLVTDELYSNLMNEVSKEITKVNLLIDGIERLVQSGKYTNGETEGVTVSQNIQSLNAIYSALSTTDKKQVTNYSVLSQAVKDVKTVEKFIKSAQKTYTEIDVLPENTEKEILNKEKKKLSKYATIYKSYLKLTPNQQDLFESYTLEFNIIDIIKDYKELLVDLNEPSAKDKVINKDTDESKYEIAKIENVKELLDELNAMVKTISSSSIQDANTKIDEVKAAYKNLSSIEKKHVDNYPVLSVANTVVKKAGTVQKTLKAAIDANTEAKLTSAIAAYKQLSGPQQALIENGGVASLVDAEGLLEDLKPDYGDLDDIFLKFSPEIMEDLSGNIIENATNEIKKAGLSTKVLKSIPFYSNYLQALKDYNTVQTFVKKIDKLGNNPTYAKKQTILTAFNKLSVAQGYIFINTFDDKNELLDNWNSLMNEASTELNKEIGSIFDASTGDYNKTLINVSGVAAIDELTVLIAKYEAKYKVLDSKEKKLVTHYPFLKTAVKDAKVVRTVVILAEQIKDAGIDEQASLNDQLERAINKLTAQQQSLFNLAMPDFKK